MTISQPQAFWRDCEASQWDKRVVVRGGAGFLGSFVVEKLRERGAAHIFVPRKAEYDLRNRDAIAGSGLGYLQTEWTTAPQARYQPRQKTRRRKARTPFEEGLKYTIEWYGGVSSQAA